jgi:hypothetical protein
MVNYDISALKAAQDAFDKRKANLMEYLVPFRDGVLEELELFTVNASEIGLRDVIAFSGFESTDEHIIAEFTIKGYEFILISKNEVAELVFPNRRLERSWTRLLEEGISGYFFIKREVMSIHHF